MTETLNPGVDRLLRPGLSASNTLCGAAAAVAAIALVAFATPAHAEVRFTVTNLGTLGGTSSEAFAINASGQVAGRATTSIFELARATRWTNGVAQDLGTLGGPISNAYGINDAGQVVGDSYLANSVSYRAVLWSADGAPSVLDASGKNASANAINNAGSVVGTFRDLDIDGSVTNMPVLWSDGIPYGLRRGPLTGVDTSIGGAALAINTAGQIAGATNGSLSRPVVWQSAAADPRLLSATAFRGAATAINTTGAIAGYYDAGLRNRVVLWQPSGETDLGSLAEVGYSFAYGLNDRGDVVGMAVDSRGSNQGFLRAGGSGGAMVNLNTLLAPGSGAEVTTARAINVYGQIAGSATIAGQTRAVLLTPTGSVAWQAGAGSANGSFADATRWEQGFLPNTFVDASIDSAGLQTVFINQASSVKNLTLGDSAGRAGRPTLLMTGGNALQVAGLFTVQGTGTLAGDGVVAGNVLNRGTVLPTNLTITGSFTNEGLVAGSGTLNATVTNGSTGQLRSGAVDLLRVNGTSHSNAGVIDIRSGGEQHYSGALANAATGRILLNDAVLRLNNGVTNAGQVQVSFGGATLYGSVATTTGGKVILSGNSQTTFFDAVSVDSGGELRVSAGSTGVFFGQVTQRTGALFTGTGTKFYEGGLAIGASPGLGLDAGSVNFGLGNLYTAEIGGTTACTAACETNAALRDSSFDKYVVSAHLALGGTLKLVSWAGFTGQIGQSFDLLDWGSSSGTFSSIDASGLALAPGAILDFNQLYSAGIVSITAVPEPGTWALWACGLGVVLLRLRARRPLR